ncbi:MAG: HIT domain-containing protein [Gammaproteobacteria bacterium]|nr:HIT domain-containing protein [Gammaproteobacteria bacterium]
MFALDPQLAQDSFVIGDFTLCRLLLMNDSQYPWCILVPKRDGLREVYQLAATDRHLLVTESCLLAETMQHVLHADKINIAALGNVVPQLHLHHIARFTTDIAWPAPVWGKFPAQAYSPAQRTSRTQALCEALAHAGNFKPCQF